MSSPTPAADPYDVLIVGGGLVGASLAAALTPLPLRIGVVEAVPFGSRGQPSFDDRVAALSWGSRRIFEGMGVWPELAPEAHPIRHIHVSDRGHLGMTRLHAQEMGVDALGYVVPNRSIGRAISEFLARTGRVALHAPARLQSVDAQADRVDAIVEQEGAPRTLSARLLVAADGAQSPVRNQLGIEGRVWEYGQAAVICNVSVEHPQPDTAFERFAKAGPAALLPFGGDRYALVLTVPEDQAGHWLEMPDEEFLAGAAARFNGRFGAFTRAGKRQSYPLKFVRAAEQRQGRVLIIGNAAHSLHPIAGQGFNLSLRDVAVLADTLADAACAGTDVGADPHLDAYLKARRRDQWGTSLFTDVLNRVFANPLAPVAFVRNAGLLTMELLPPVRRGLMRRTMGLGGRQPRLARGVPLA